MRYISDLRNSYISLSGQSDLRIRTGSRRWKLEKNKSTRSPCTSASTHYLPYPIPHDLLSHFTHFQPASHPSPKYVQYRTQLPCLCPRYLATYVCVCRAQSMSNQPYQANWNVLAPCTQDSIYTRTPPATPHVDLSHLHYHSHPPCRCRCRCHVSIS